MIRKNAENKLTSRPPIRKFSPGTYQSDEEIISQFVVRNHELKTILEVLHGNIKSSSCQHVLVVAPRGRGKTMLLARAAAELRTKEKFSEHLLPVQFMEESQEIFNLADFWLETLFHLAREIAAYDPELAQELRETYAALTDRWQEREIGDHARATVLAAADQLGRKLVLMVENLQALCESVDEDFGWKLREVLQSEPQIMLLASATSRFESLDDVEQPFFELFRIVSLERLATKDCQLLWEVVSGKEASEREIRPLEILTGGSPRLLVIIAEFARHGSMRQLMEELVALIDEHTEYFRGHLENLPNMERRVYLAVIDLWQPSKPSEIAARARMDVRKVSTMLGRLMGRGAVIVEGSGKKRLYVAAERLYSIYYRLRRERDEAVVVQNLIYFMAVFYSEFELYSMSNNLIEEAAQSRTIREGIERAIAEQSRIEDEFCDIKWQTIRQISNQALENYRLMNKQLLKEKVHKAFKEKDPKKAIEIVNQALASQNTSPSTIPEFSIAFLFERKILGYEQLANFEAVITTCSEFIKRFRNIPELEWRVASVMIDKGNALGELDNFEAAIKTYDKVIKDFGDADAQNLQWEVASAMIQKGNTLEKLNDFEAAIKTYDKVIESFADTDAQNLQHWVVSAIIDKGNALEKLGDFEAAIKTYDKVIKDFGDTDAKNLQWRIAWAMIFKGNALEKLGDFEAAIKTYDKVVESFADTPDLQNRVVTAMIDKAKTLEKLGDFEAAIKTYDKVIKDFGDADAQNLQWEVASAMIQKGNTLEKLNDFEAAIKTYDKLIEHFGDIDAQDLQWEVASAMIQKGNTLEKLNDFEAAIKTYDKLIESFADTDAQDLQYWVVSAMIDKGNVLRELNDFEAAIKTYDKLIESFADTDAQDLQWEVASAMISKGNVLRELNDFEAAIKTYDKLIEHFGDIDAQDLQYWVASAMINKAELQIKTYLSEDALLTCEKFEQKFGLRSDKNTRFAWQAMCVRTLALTFQKKHRDAMNVLQLIYDKFLPGNKTMMHSMLQLVPDIIAIGFPVHDLIDILSSDDKKSDTLMPLIIALLQHSGQTVHAPAEVLEVAADIRKQIKEKTAKYMLNCS